MQQKQKVFAVLLILVLASVAYYSISSLKADINIELRDPSPQNWISIPKETAPANKTAHEASKSNKSRFAVFNKCRKWIVVTSINKPTEHVKYLNDALMGWCVVIAGDKKTPQDWNYKSIVYLSVRDQAKLAERYRIVAKIPWSSYLRKMVGYLYAIENGAEFIYETDDDNSPMDGLHGFRFHTFKVYGFLNKQISESHL
jgi:hypothetical protein